MTDFVKGMSQLKTKSNFFEWILERVKEFYPSEEVGSEYLAYCLDGCKDKPNVIRRIRAALSLKGTQ